MDNKNIDNFDKNGILFLVSALWGKITKKIDENIYSFTESKTRENITSSDPIKIILGKIMKWFSDLSAGAASSLLGQNLTENKALISDTNGKVAASDVDASKVEFLSGVTSDIQEQINSLNSTLEGMGGGSETNLPNGAFVYVLKTSSISFVNASGNTNARTVYGALDYFKNEISKHEAGCINFVYPAVGYNLPIIFSKLGTQGAVGMIMDYTNSKPPVFFNFYDNQYRICDPQSVN
nr:hypothetical protein [uncultured Schaedlerella sp.]